MFGLGFQEILIILIAGLLLFGASKLPKIAKSLGQSVQEFKKGLDGGAEDTSERPETKKIAEEEKCSCGCGDKKEHSEK
jgi:sec-independent protein translocase protein TatA